MSRRDGIDRFRVRPGEKVRLADHDTGWVPKGLRAADSESVKQRAKRHLEKRLGELRKLQGLLWSSDVYAVLVVLQGMDAAGKDGLIEHVMTGMNPQGVDVWPFKEPSREELEHDFLWRCSKALPERGHIAVFNRSYYEEVLVVRVRPELLDPQRVPKSERGKALWKKRYDSINRFEDHLVANGTVVVKCFLHISKEEQRRRFLARLEDPEKRWKFSLSDVEDRQRWDDYVKAYEDALEATTTKDAPWYVVPADHKWAARAVVADILVERMRELHLEYPKISLGQNKELMQARRLLEQEKGKG